GRGAGEGGLCRRRRLGGSHARQERRRVRQLRQSGHRPGPGPVRLLQRSDPGLVSGPAILLREAITVTYAERAVTYFLAGYNCAQATFLPFAEDLGCEADFALRLTSSFGGGMGRLREVCGALSGIFLAAGLLYGYTAPGDDQAKAAHYAR